MEGDHGKRPLEDGVVTPEKKQRKSLSQVQILESAYKVTLKPSAELKMQLAQMAGLEFKQVQAWFGNRRSLDRHGPRVYKPKNANNDKHIALPSLLSAECSKDGAGHSNSHRHLLSPQPISAIAPPDMVPPKRMLSHFRPMPEGQLPWELQGKLQQVEGKLGHRLIAEGPELGVEFEPLPPGAFGFSLESTPKKRTLSHFSAGKAVDRLNNRLKGHHRYVVTCETSRHF